MATLDKSGTVTLEELIIFKLGTDRRPSKAPD